MLIVMKSDATREQIEAAKARVRELGFVPCEIPGTTRIAIGVTGNQEALAPSLFSHLPGIAEALRVSRPFKLTSREVKPDDTVISVKRGDGGVSRIGGGHFGVIAGPGAVEGREQLRSAAEAVKAAGAHFLRGVAYMPQTSPYSFQGLKEDGLKILAEARAVTGLPVVTEVMDPRDVPVVSRYADVVMIGSRNMQNFALLEAVGAQPRPVLLKRGMGATIQELLMAAEYILKQGNYNVVLCERGIRTFETMTPTTLDLGAVPLLKRLSHLPVVVDPSHGTGDRQSVPALARAAVAVGADGLMIEVHPDPARALSDGPQSLTPALFEEVMAQVRSLAPLVGMHT